MNKSQGAVILSIGLVLMSTYLVRTVVVGALGLSAVYLLMTFIPSWLIPLAPLLGAFSALRLNPIYIYISAEVRDGERGLAVNSVDLIVNLSFLLLPLFDPLIPVVGSRNILLVPVVMLMSSLAILVLRINLLS